MTMKQYVEAFITLPQEIAEWNSFTPARRKAELADANARERKTAQLKKQYAKQAKAAEKRAQKAAKTAAKKMKSAKPDPRRAAGHIQNFWKTTGPTWGDGSPMQ